MSWTPKDPARLEYIYAKACALSLKGNFTYQQLSAEVGVPVNSVNTLCRGWEEEGKLERVQVEKSAHVHMKVPDHLNSQRIRISANQKDTAQDRMWRVIRKLGAFDASDVAMYANAPELQVSREEALSYCRMLCRSGYLRVLRKAVPGQKFAVYRLIRNTGPRAPREKRIRAVWDENLGQITHLPEGTS